MNKITVKYYRQLLFFSVAEAATDIANSSAKNWQQYEQGKRAVHDDVAEKLEHYVSVRATLIEGYREQVENQLNTHVRAVLSYPKPNGESALSETAFYNLHNAALATLKAEYGEKLHIEK